jgi:hypothetical protein
MNFDDLYNSLNTALQGAGFSLAPSYFNETFVSSTIRNKQYSIVPAKTSVNPTRTLGAGTEYTRIIDIFVFFEARTQSLLPSIMNDIDSAIASLDSLSHSGGADYIKVNEATQEINPESGFLVSKITIEVQYTGGN